MINLDPHFRGRTSGKQKDLKWGFYSHCFFRSALRKISKMINEKKLDVFITDILFYKFRYMLSKTKLYTKRKVEYKYNLTLLTDE